MWPQFLGKQGGLTMIAIDMREGQLYSSLAHFHPEPLIIVLTLAITVKIVVMVTNQ